MFLLLQLLAVASCPSNVHLQEEMSSIFTSTPPTPLSSFREQLDPPQKTSPGQTNPVLSAAPHGPRDPVLDSYGGPTHLAVGPHTKEIQEVRT